MTTHFFGSPLRKLASFPWPVKVLKRRASLETLKPDCPPSPKMIWGQTLARAVVLERSVVLGAALEQVLRPLGARRQALELKGREAIVHVDELVRARC